MTEKIFSAYSITEDVAANRPATPSIPSGMLCIYLATDTHALSVWDGAQWVTPLTSGVTLHDINSRVFVGL